MNRLAIVVPCYNEEEALGICSEELRKVLADLISKDKISADSFLLFVDDGSKDRTWSLIEEQHKTYPDRVKGLKLSRNEGHQRCLTAGMTAAMDYCDMMVSIDADLQDDILAIEKMVDKFHEGCEVVYGVRENRDTDTWFKRNSANAFYKLMTCMGVNTVDNHADFRLLSKRVVQEFCKYDETNLYLRGIVPLLGFKNDQVLYSRKERVAGESKYPLKKMLQLAFDGISSFSVKPIRLVLFLGMLIIAVSCLAFLYALVSYATGHVVAGWTSLILSIWFLGGLQLLAIGLVGEYIGKIYMEVKHRPRYHVEKTLLD